MRASEHGRSMTRWVRERSLPVRVLLYAALAALAFFLAAGMGAMAALMWRGDADPSEAGGVRSAGEPNPERTQQQSAAVEKEETDVELRDVASGQDKTAARNADTSKRDEAKYVGAVGDIQAEAVKPFLSSHEKLLRYDALSAGDVEEMEANAATLQETKIRAANLVPPEKYEEQHEVFSAAIGELHEAARLAHGMAADPIAAAELGFDAYDGHVSEASELLQRSNELLGKEYETIGGVREVSPEL
ncbi:MAG TPA: hypothetical protein VGV91_15305 [Rubrobacter sp.]|nr:hypothetical protein [Rubrobacter sp.]